MTNNNSSNTEANDLTDFFGPVISKYSRADALRDGVLVDVTPTARTAGYRYPMALSQDLWVTIHAIPRSTSWQDPEGRLWDCLWMGVLAIKRAPEGCSRITFELRLSMTGSRKRNQTLVVDLGPGDNGEPVFTMGFPGDF